MKRLFYLKRFARLSNKKNIHTPLLPSLLLLARHAVMPTKTPANQKPKNEFYRLKGKITSFFASKNCLVNLLTNLKKIEMTTFGCHSAVQIVFVV